MREVPGARDPRLTSRPVDPEAPTEAQTLEDEPRKEQLWHVDAAGLARGTTVGRYVVIDKIGQGGMGAVYSAYDQVLHRRVALKLVTAGRDRDAQDRLLAEARTMAQLDHPAIVVVHDVGELSGQVWLAMEFVEGETLRAWQTRKVRSWREIVAMYRAIGAGLAVAHDAGVIHRDFKPDNVLVDAAGHPHVTDFGLAKVAPAGESAQVASPSGVHTIAGKAAGTPGYMSPEQAHGEPTDARTDQYAFCVSLFEALHGGRPHDDPPPHDDLPRGVLAAIRRGLEEDRTRRWPSLRELLAELAPPEPRRRRLAMAGGAAVVAIAGVALLASRRAPARPTCEAPEAHARWSTARPEVIAAFARAGVPADALVTALDGWADRWTDMAQSSCRATQLGAQSPQLLDLRTSCLDHALDVTTSLVDLARRADPAFAKRGRRIAAGLPDLEPCEDIAGLLGITPLPADPARRALIAELRKRLAAAEAAADAESYEAAQAQLDALVAPARSVGYPPLAFEVEAARSNIEILRNGDPAAAAEAAWQAIAADPTRSDRLVASLWIDLVWIVGEMQHAPAQAIELGKVAQALADRVADHHLLALLDHRLGTVLADVGRNDEAIARFERARSAYLALHDDASALASLQGEAIAAGARGDARKQIALYEQGVAIAGHLPHARIALATLLSALSIAYREADRDDDALAALRRAQATLGDRLDDAPLVAAIHGNLGNVWESKGDLAAAETEYQAELSIAKTLGPDQSDTQLAWFNVGSIENKRGAHRDALASMREAWKILQRIPPDAVARGAYASPGVIARQLVTAHLGLGHPADALAAAEELLAFTERTGAGAGATADAHEAVAEAAWATGDRERARAMMRQAIAEYRQAGASSEDAEDWLRSH